MLSVIVLALQLSQFQAHSALSPLLQVPFFKSTDSLFPSGSTTLEVLQKQHQQKAKTPDTAYRWNGKNFKKDELKPVLPVHLSDYVLEVGTQKRWRVLDVGVDALKVQDPLSKLEKNLSTSQVLSDSFDLGYALILKDTYLRKTSSNEGSVLTTIPQGFRLKPLYYQDGFFKVQYKDYLGFVSLGEALTKFDMATMVYSDNQWHFVIKREFGSLITNTQKKISMNLIQKIITPDTRGIIASSNQKVPLWSHIEIVKTEKNEWNRSDVKGHGSVWWKTPDDEKKSPISEQAVLIDQLIRQPISSVSFHPKNPMRGILSSNGVYLTDDGLHWKRVKQFDDYNGPVHYFNEVLIFVGNYRSTDGGKTFENYIQIDRLAQAIQDQYGFLPRRLQVNKIETMAPYRIRIEIETGFRKIKMESPLFTQDWKAAKI
jgi:hypothetical protein